MTETLFPIDPPALKKFTPPPLRNILAREALFNLLDQSAQTRAAWISGPAGAGKSTLMASYLAERKTACIWYRVDSGDSDLATFFYYLRLAVDQISDIRQPHLPLLSPEYLPGLEMFVGRFFESLCRRFKRPLWIIFDNLHEASAQSRLMQVMCQAVEHVSRGVKLGLISRSEPPPMMARVLAVQRMFTLGWPDLAFTPGEYAKIIAMLAPGARSATLAEHLHRLTGGWVAGLILCLKQTPRDTVLPDMPEGHSRIFDYFAGELLHTLMPQWRRFLIQSALLDAMSAAQAARLTKIEGAEDILDSLLERNFFIGRDDGPVKTYRYHPLFRDFLRLYLVKTTKPEALRKLYCRAAAIMAESGSINEAIRLYALAGEWDGLVELILSQAPQMAAQGRHSTLQKWLQLLPPGVSEQRPMLIFYQGLCRLATAPLQAREYFTRAFDRFVQLNDLEGRLLSWSYIVESIYIARGSTRELIEWIQEGERLNARLPSDWRDSALSIRFAYGMLTAMTFGAPGHSQLAEWLERCSRSLMQLPDLNQQLNLAHTFVVASCLRGEIDEAAIVIEHFKSRAMSIELPVTGRISLCLMECLFFMVTGESEKCRSKAKEALTICKQWGVHVFDCLLHAYSTYAALSTENWDAARANLDQFAVCLPLTAAFDLSQFYSLSAWEAYALGDLHRALALSKKGEDFALQSGWPMVVLVAKVLRAKLLAETHRRQEAEEFILEALRESRTHGLVLAEFYGLLALTELRMVQGAFEEMREPLTQAFTISRTRGVMAANWSLRGRMAELCDWALRFGIEERQVRLFIRRHHLLPRSSRQAHPDWPFTVKIYVLGRHAIVCRGHPIARSGKSPKKVFELLDLLVCNGPRGIRREMAADRLWPEASGDRGHQNLNTTLYRLRQMLGEGEAILIEDGRLMLSQRHCQVDAWCFEEAVDHALASDAADDKIKLLQKAVSGYGAPPAADRIQAYGERLRTKFIHAILEMGRLMVESGKPEAAVSVYKRALKIEETSEPLCRALIQMLGETGQTAEALKLYNRYRKTILFKEKSEPGTEIQGLYRAIKKRARTPD